MAVRRRHKSKLRTSPILIKLGDSVRVKAGVQDPDFRLPLSGWQGRVIAIEEGSVDIAWDSLTLQTMPTAMIDRCEVEGLDWAEMRLPIDEVEPVELRDTVAAVARVKRAITTQHAWAFLGEPGLRIQKILCGIEPEDDTAALKAWRKHLTVALAFPFDAVVTEHVGPFRVGEKVVVTALSDVIDDTYGLIAELGAARVGYAYPLCDLEATRKSPAQQLVQDYAVWFANR